MPVAAHTDFLVPNTTFMIEFVVFLGIFGLTVLWPLIGAVVRRQWVWVVAIVVLGPLAGIAWLTVARRVPGAVSPAA